MTFFFFFKWWLLRKNCLKFSLLRDRDLKLPPLVPFSLSNSHSCSQQIHNANAVEIQLPGNPSALTWKSFSHYYQLLLPQRQKDFQVGVDGFPGSWNFTFTYTLFNDPTRDSIANNFVIGVYCICLEILSQIAFSSIANY